MAVAGLRCGMASVVAHAVTPHLRAHSILAQIVENGSSYPLCARHIIFSFVGFEPTISAGERPQTKALDRAATGTGF